MAEVRMLELCRRKHGKVTKENEMSVLSEINELVKKAQFTPSHSYGTTAKKWSGVRRGGVTQEQAKRDPLAAQRWRDATDSRRMIDKAISGRRSVNLNSLPTTPASAVHPGPAASTSWRMFSEGRGSIMNKPSGQSPEVKVNNTIF